MKATITLFPVGNGDMTLIGLDNGQNLLVDIKVRKAADDPADPTPDVMSDLRKRLRRDAVGRLYADAFLLTHPDQDHISGLSAHFHLGPLKDWSRDQDKIVIREMWSSPVVFRRASTTHVLCDDAKAWAAEARRRVKIYRDTRFALEGDRIQIMGEDVNGKTDDITGIVVPVGEFVTRLDGVSDGSFEAKLLGPLDAGDDEELADLLAKNRSSVILRFSLRGEGVAGRCLFLSGGDAEVAVWERLWDIYEHETHWLEYHLLQTPHHCSWHSLSHDSYSDLGEDAEVSQDARNALSQTRKGAVAIASSKTIDPNDADPPSDRARREYVDIVGSKDRFVCVADVWDKERQALEFEIGAAGVVRKVPSASKAAAAALGIGATAAQARGHG